MESKKYEKAPITEAIIDIRFEPEDEPNLENLAKLRSLLEKDYPKVVKQVENQFLMRPGEKPEAQVKVHETGLRFIHSSEKYVLQLQKKSFTLSRLAPYVGWAEFSAEAHRVWTEFTKLIKPKTIVRTAVRFINRFDLPDEVIELEDYFKVYPTVPKGMDLNGIVLQLIIPQPTIQSDLIINQALVLPTYGKTISILLDLDLYNIVPKNTDKDLWDFIGVLQKRKNEIFEELITDKTRKLIS